MRDMTRKEWAENLPETKSKSLIKDLKNKENCKKQKPTLREKLD